MQLQYKNANILFCLFYIFFAEFNQNINKILYHLKCHEVLIIINFCTSININGDYEIIVKI